MIKCVSTPEWWHTRWQAAWRMPWARILSSKASYKIWPSTILMWTPTPWWSSSQDILTAPWRSCLHLQWTTPTTTVVTLVSGLLIDRFTMVYCRVGRSKPAPTKNRCSILQTRTDGLSQITGLFRYRSMRGISTELSGQHTKTDHPIPRLFSEEGPSISLHFGYLSLSADEVLTFCPKTPRWTSRCSTWRHLSWSAIYGWWTHIQVMDRILHHLRVWIDENLWLLG